MKPTIEHAKKIIELLGFGLVKGMGVPEPGKLCIEAAVCLALGEPHGDEPSCVGSAVRSFKIALNDCNWSSNEARANGLRRIGIAQLGSNTIDQNIFVKELALSIIRKVVPVVLRAVAGMKGNAKHKASLEDHASKCESVKDLNAASDAASYASDAASYASDAASDKVLTLVAECGVEALIVCKSPGCEWLYLCDEKEAA